MSMCGMESGDTDRAGNSVWGNFLINCLIKFRREAAQEDYADPTQYACVHTQYIVIWIINILNMPRYGWNMEQSINKKCYIRGKNRNI